jgi:hypothetical protein
MQPGANRRMILSAPIIFAPWIAFEPILPSPNITTFAPASAFAEYLRRRVTLVPWEGCLQAAFAPPPSPNAVHSFHELLFLSRL